jgi:hypothetical protein
MSDPFILAEDRAMKNLLVGLTVSDEKNPSRPVKVWYGYPDVEVRDQTYPYIIIDLIDISPANDRQHSGFLYDSDYRGTQLPQQGKTYKYEYPVAYDLLYQVSTFTRHPRHDRALAYDMLNIFPSKYGHLEVPNQLGTESSFRHMFLEGFAKQDRVESDSGTRRLLRNVFTVRVVSEMTPQSAASALQAVETIHLTLNQMDTLSVN